MLVQVSIPQLFQYPNTQKHMYDSAKCLFFCVGCPKCLLFQYPIQDQQISLVLQSIYAFIAKFIEIVHFFHHLCLVKKLKTLFQLFVYQIFFLCSLNCSNVPQLQFNQLFVPGSVIGNLLKVCGTLKAHMCRLFYIFINREIHVQLL